MYIKPKSIFEDIIYYRGIGQFKKQELSEKLGLDIGTVKNIFNPTTGMSPDGLRNKAKKLGFYLELEMTNNNIKDFRIFATDMTEIKDFKRVYSLNNFDPSKVTKKVNKNPVKTKLSEKLKVGRKNAFNQK